MTHSQRPLVSVIVPLYNKHEWIKRCLQSILVQTFTDFELLVVNDGSTDDGEKIVETFIDGRIRLINQANAGVSAARNTGINQAKGQYLAFIDADDEWRSQHLYWLLECFKRFPAAILSCSNYQEILFDHMNSVDPNIHEQSCFNCHLIKNYLETLAQGRFILSGSSVMIKREVMLDKQILFNTSLACGEDINCWLHLQRHGDFVHCDYLGLLYHRADNDSAMNKVEADAQLMPSFFAGLTDSLYDKHEFKTIKKFLTKEYYKKAYQNRGLGFKKTEMTTNFDGNIKINHLKKMTYLAIRFCPQWVINLFKKLRNK